MSRQRTAESIIPPRVVSEGTFDRFEVDERYILEVAGALPSVGIGNAVLLPYAY